MSLGSLSTYPSIKDDLYNIYDELYAGYPITKEYWQIPDGLEITLKHYAKTGTLAISGFTEVFVGSPAQGQFKVTDYAIPTVTNTGIDYNIGRTVQFHSNDKGRKIYISYTTPGDKLLASLFNLLIDAIYNMQGAVGTMGTGGDLQLGLSKSLAQKVSYLLSLLATHTHEGTISAQLTTSAFSALALSNTNIAADANISGSKLQYGIIEKGTSSIAIGDTTKVINTANISATTDVIISRGSVDHTDGNDQGILRYKEKTNGTSFTVEFIQSGSPRTGIVAFTYMIVKDSG